MNRSLIALVVFFFFSNIKAERLPIWELGLGVGYGKIPYYRGAANDRNIILPLPLASFRGKKYANDKRREWVFSNRLTLGPSVSIGLPVPEDNHLSARAGMPGLDGVLELGPKINVQLLRKRRHRLAAIFPFRLASSVSFSSVVYRGWLFSPFILYTYEKRTKNAWKVDILAGPLYASRAYNDYYYSVNRAQVSEKRRFYKATRGYSGSRLTLVVQKSYYRFWGSVFARYDVMTGAVFAKSPLVEKENFLFGGFAFGWMFKKSAETTRIHAQ